MNNEIDLRLNLEQLQQLVATLKDRPSTPALREVLEQATVKLKRLQEQHSMNILVGK